MIYWELLVSFLRVGLFSFGGAYGAIPLIREEVLRRGWLSDEALSYMIAELIYGRTGLYNIGLLTLVLDSCSTAVYIACYRMEKQN